MKNTSYRGLAFRVALFYCIVTLAGVCQSPPPQSQFQPEISFRVAHDTLIILSFEVNQQGPFDFLFDTGTDVTTVDSSLANKLSLTPQGHLLQVSVAGRQTLVRSSIDTLALGPAQVERLPVLIADLAVLRKIDGRIQGIAGQDFLSHFNYLLDYRRHSIRVEQGDEVRNAIEGEPVPMELRLGKMIVNAESRSARSEKLRLALDSGANSIVLMRDASERLKLPIREDGWGAAPGGEVAAHVATVHLLSVGTKQFHDVSSWLSTQTAEQFADGLLPTVLFQALYVNNRESFVVFNPRIKRKSLP
jgi:predicted aspartyl protease